MYYIVYGVFHSQFSHHYVSAAIAAAFRVLLLHEYKVQMSLVVSPSLHNN